MRGTDSKTDALFVYLSPESFVPKDHPLRPIKAMADTALAELDAEFEKMYSSTGRPSIPPEKLLKALLLQAFYSVRSNRLLVEQVGYNVLFRWFLGLALDEAVWDHSVFSVNQERLIGSDAARLFLEKVLEQARKAKLLSNEHFSVDGTLIEAWASIKSFKPKDGPPSASGGGRNPEVDFHGKKLKNETHGSTTDPDARLYRKGKGKEAKLSYMGHALMENRNGLIVDTRVTHATGTAEREAGAEMVEQVSGSHRITIAGDKNYDTKDFVETMRSSNATPHVAQNDTNRRSAIDGRTTRHEGYALSQKTRKRIEESFGWFKVIGNFRKTRYIGPEKVDWYFTITAVAYNLTRMRNLGVAAT